MTSLPSGSIRKIPTPQSSDEINLGELLSILWRGKFMVFLVATLTVLVGGYYAFFMATPLYRASAVIMLESREQQIVDLESVIGGLSGDTPAVNSEVEVLRSRKLMRKVVDRLDLTLDPEFNATIRPPGTKSRIKAFLGLAPASTPAPSEKILAQRSLESTIEGVLQHVTIQNIRQSVVFRITAETVSPEKSALIADSLAELYILNQLEVKFEATRRATSWLTERVNQLQTDLETAEGRLTEFNAGTDLINVEILQGLERQQKELRERVITSTASASTTTAKTAALAGAVGRDAQAAVADDPQLSRLSQKLAESPDGQILRAFDIRFAQIVAKAGLDVKRAESQLAALKLSQSDLETQIRGQSQDLLVLQQLTREAEASRLLYEYFLGRLKETSVQQGIQQADSRVISDAVVPLTTSAPRRSLILVVSGFLGLMLGAAVVLIREMRKNTFRTARDLERFTGHTVMGQIPLFPTRKRKETLTYLADKPSSAVAEAIRNMRTSVMLSNIDKPPQIIVLTSALPGEGKTALAFALAQNLVGMQKKVLLIEGDIRLCVFGQYLEDASAKGLLAILSGEATMEEVVQHDRRIGADILVGEVSSTNAADIFSSKKFSDFLLDARKIYDVIIVDTPPVLVVPDARVIGQFADAILFAVKWDATSKSQVEEALRMFEPVNLKVAGLVLCQISPKGMKRYGYGEDFGAYSSYGKKYFLD